MYMKKGRLYRPLLFLKNGIIVLNCACVNRNIRYNALKLLLSWGRVVCNNVTTLELERYRAARCKLILNVYNRSSDFQRYYEGVRLALHNPYVHSVIIYPKLRKFLMKRLCTDIGFNGCRKLIPLFENPEYALEFKIDHVVSGLVVGYVPRMEYDLCGLSAS